MNREKVYELLKLISDAYPNFDFDQGKIDNWSRLLKGQNAEQVIRNAERYILENKFPPSISDVRQVKREAHTSDFLKKFEKWKGEASGLQKR